MFLQVEMPKVAKKLDREDISNQPPAAREIADSSKHPVYRGARQIYEAPEEDSTPSLSDGGAGVEL